MKKVILCLAVMIALIATKSQAQQNMSKMQEAWRSYLKDTMKLADPMVDSVMAVRMQYQPQMRQIFMDQSATPADKQAKIQGLRSEMDTRYKADGLTDAQIQDIHTHEERLRAEMQSRMNNGGQ
jgi:ABC-type sulfate transport system substrate-binding protein